MRKSTLARIMALTGLVMTMMLGMASVAFAQPSFPVTPNFGGATMQAGATLNLSWTSTLAPGETLMLEQTTYSGPDFLTQSSTALASGLPANGSYLVTIPSTAIGLKVNYRLRTANFSSYSDSMFGGVNAPWQINVVAAVAPPVVSTPASSPWSLALGAVATLGLMAAVPAVRRRFAGPKA
jgi:hypothetical protein